MPLARLQRTRDAYQPLSVEQVIDTLLSAVLLPHVLSCGCRRVSKDAEHPENPDVFFCVQHQNMGRAYLGLPLLEE